MFEFRPLKHSEGFPCDYLVGDRYCGKHATHMMWWEGPGDKRIPVCGEHYKKVKESQETKET